MNLLFRAQEVVLLPSSAFWHPVEVLSCCLCDGISMLDSHSSWRHSWTGPASFLDSKLVSLEVAWVIGHLKGQGGKKATCDRDTAGVRATKIGKTQDKGT